MGTNLFLPVSSKRWAVEIFGLSSTQQRVPANVLKKTKKGGRITRGRTNSKLKESHNLISFWIQYVAKVKQKIKVLLLFTDFNVILNPQDLCDR